MAITGRFDADFGTFYEACRQAEVSLKGFDATTKGVERSINDMVDSFSGRRIVQEATLMSEAVGRMGGPMRLTTSEARRVSQVAEEAVEKFRRWGQEVPPNIQRVADATRGANNNLGQLSTSIRQVDNVLALFGVNLGPARKGLDDLAFATEQGTSKLGKVATAGLAVGAGIAGWQIGRAAAEFFDLDQKIGNATARLLGFGDVAAQTAAAKADTLARASKQVGFQINDLTTAMIINAAAAEDATAKNKKFGDEIARADGPRKSAEQIAKYTEEINQLKRQGLLDALTKDINSHSLSMQQLSDNYRISTEALAIYAREAANLDRIEKNNAQKLAALNAQFDKANADRILNAKKEEEARIAALYADIDARTKANQAAKDADLALMDQQIRARQETEKTTAALRRQADAAREAAATFVVTRDYDLSTQKGMDEFKRLNPKATVNASTEYFKTNTLEDAIRAGLVNLFGNPHALAPSGAANSAYQSSQASTYAADNQRNGYGPQPVYIPPDATGFAMSGASSRGAGITIVAPVSVSGVFDPSAKAALGNAVGDGIMRRVLAMRRG